MDQASLDKSRRDIARWSGYYARIFGEFSPSEPTSLYSGHLRNVKIIQVIATPVRPAPPNFLPTEFLLVTHDQFMKRHPGFRFAPPAR